MFALGNVDPDFDDMATKRTESEYILAAQNSLSIAGMCRYLGLKPCGGNYRLMHNAILQYYNIILIPVISVVRDGTETLLSNLS